MNGRAGVRLSVSALRPAAGIAALLAGLGACAYSPPLTPVTITPGCYAVQGDSWPAALARATGLSGLPSFVGLDTAVAGPGGRHVVVPAAWALSGARRRHAYWTEELHGNRPASLLVTFSGPAAELVAALEPSGEGYAGTAAVPARSGAAAPPGPSIRVRLVAVSCGGLRLREFEDTP